MGYCTAVEVAAFLQRDAFDGSSKPTLTAVNTEIDVWTAHINSETGHAWEATTVTYEYHDFPWSHRKMGLYELPASLYHRSIISTQKIEVWDGSQWEDFVATRTEGRQADWWMEKTNGILHFRAIKPWMNRSGFRVDYTYGETSPPADIKGACIRLVSIAAITGTHLQIELGMGAGVPVQYSDRVERWQTESDNIIKRHLEPMGAFM